MSATTRKRAIAAPDIAAMKGGEPIVSLTAYTTPVARLVDDHCDFVLVGDSLGVVVHGMASTVGVTLDMMVLHSQAVARGLTRPLMVVDLPFGSYEQSPRQAFESASRLMAEGGAGAVKLEGGRAMAETIAFLTARGIPVMAHLGLLPQAIHTVGGYKVQGRGEAADAILADARAVEAAGAFCAVLEKITAPLAGRITAELAIPTIGIGASAACDGQILVVDDMLGLFEDFRPKFVRRYGEWASSGREAIAAYAADVRARNFPGPEHIFEDQAPAGQKSGNGR